MSDRDQAYEYMVDSCFVRAIAQLDRAQCTELLTGVCIQVYETETLDELREAVRVNYLDGTIGIHAITAVENGG